MKTLGALELRLIFHLALSLSLSLSLSGGVGSEEHRLQGRHSRWFR